MIKNCTHSVYRSRRVRLIDDETRERVSSLRTRRVAPASSPSRSREKGRARRQQIAENLWYKLWNAFKERASRPCSRRHGDPSQRHLERVGVDSRRDASSSVGAFTAVTSTSSHALVDRTRAFTVTDLGARGATTTVRSNASVNSGAADRRPTTSSRAVETVLSLARCLAIHRPRRCLSRVIFADATRGRPVEDTRSPPRAPSPRRVSARARAVLALRHRDDGVAMRRPVPGDHAHSRRAGLRVI